VVPLEVAHELWVLESIEPDLGLLSDESIVWSGNKESRWKAAQLVGIQLPALQLTIFVTLVCTGNVAMVVQSLTKCLGHELAAK